ncbi:hypothetical protein [Streptomyces sp. NPDC051776]|uniref:hypothetical protein n=1 Tax=Streptomyces sp. NPDC051776 TaxID=3155414 RepID=UPI0034406343
MSGGATDLWNNFGHFGAAGMPGAEALVLEINRIVYTHGIKSPITTRRGIKARLNYLDSPSGRAELRTQGFADRTIKNWMRGKTTPRTKDVLDRLDNAYWTRRRENLVRSGRLKRFLTNEGRGRRVEIYPVDQTDVTPGRVRVIEQRTLQVRYGWDDIVDAWAARDLDELDAIWEDTINEIGSELAAYAYVSAIGIGV